jgi:hypothetical protein
MDYNEIKNIVLNVGSNSVSVFGGNFEGGYNLQQDPDEVTNLILSLRDLKFKNYLEIGVAAAGFTRLLMDFVSINDVCTIDLGTHPSIPISYINNIKNLKNTGQHYSFIGNSHSESAKKWLQDKNKKFDIIFIDGDHSYNGVVEDLMLAKQFAEDNCIFIFHDHACVPDINRLYNEMIQNKFKGFQVINSYISSNDTKKGIFVAKYKVN